MYPVFLLFLLPVGGGIPAGVLLAQSKGLPWALTAALYLLSDVALAFALEPVLRLLVRFGKRVAFLAKLGAALKVAMAKSAASLGGTSAGPLALIAVSFGVDPMTGRAAALAAGHGAVAGWAFAITGDMLYYAVMALVTLRLNAWIRNPNLTVMLMLVAMMAVPSLARRLRSGLRR